MFAADELVGASGRPASTERRRSRPEPQPRWRSTTFVALDPGPGDRAVVIGGGPIGVLDRRRGPARGRRRRWSWSWIPCRRARGRGAGLRRRRSGRPSSNPAARVDDLDVAGAGARRRRSRRSGRPRGSAAATRSGRGCAARARPFAGDLNPGSASPFDLFRALRCGRGLVGARVDCRVDFERAVEPLAARGDSRRRADRRRSRRPPPRRRHSRPWRAGGR